MPNLHAIASIVIVTTPIRRTANAVAIAALMLLSLFALQTQAQTSASARVALGKLTVSGASTISPLVNDIARRFEALRPGVTIDVRPVGSERGMADLRAGASDIAMLPRALLKNERELFSFPIARDGVAVVVHRDNPVIGIERPQLTQVLTGKVANWKSLGGRDAPIRLAWRKGHGSFELMLERLHLRREQIGSHIINVPSAQVIAYIASEPDAVTLMSVGIAERSVQAGAPIKLLAYDGIQASSRSIQNHNYGLSRPLVLVTDTLPAGLEKQFIDYALSGAVVDLQLKYGFVPTHIRRLTHAA